MTKPIGVQLYTLRDEIAADRDGVLRRLAGIGYGAVEPFRPGDDPKGFRALTDELGLAVPSTHCGALLREEPGPILDDIATIGAELAIIPAGLPEDSFTTQDGLHRAADILNALSERVTAHGLRLGYHNHDQELAEVDGAYALETLASLLAPEVCLEVDTYWAAVAGVDVEALLGRLGDRVLALHVKDGPGTRRDPQLALGEGVMEIGTILAAAPDAWRVVELDHCATDMFEAVAASYTYLAGLEGA